jgi:hypothetical protein
MKGHVRGALGAVLAIGITLVVSAPATAQTTGNETLSGTIVARYVSGSRIVLGTVVMARGAFSGVGRVVEIENRPTDPDNISRDDLVFADGSMHLVTTTLGGSFSLDPRNCILSVTLQQTQTIDGGTGRFVTATGSFAGTLTGRGLARRNTDGSCSEEQAPVFELAAFTLSGSLSF